MRAADFLMLCAGVLLNALAQLGLKAATNRTGPLHLAPDEGHRLLAILAIPPFWWAMLAYGASVLIWVIALSRVPVGQAYPLLSLGYVLNLGLAWWLLGEIPNAQRIAGILVIMAGVAMVAKS